MDNRAVLDDLIDSGRHFDRRGWVPASGGNFSARLDDRIVVTRSGCHKGQLDHDAFVAVDASGESTDPARRASAEALLHVQVYRRLGHVGAVLHTHSIAATVISRRCEVVELSGYELLKVFDGIKTHEQSVTIPVFENNQDMSVLASQVDAAFDQGRVTHGYLIRGHGMYTWGRNTVEARHRIEALEFLLQCELEE